MTHTVPILARISSRNIGLEAWMDRVLELEEKVRQNWDPDMVHDIRVALRRCRTMADALSEVNPGPGWHRLKKSSRQLFQTLGILRDTQVAKDWVRKLGAPGEPLRVHLLRGLTRQERTQRDEAARVIARFDRKDWRKLSHKLSPKAQFFPLESVVFQRLALTSLNDAAGFYRRARRGRSRIAWHRLRVGLKRFRYLVENFLPQRYEIWGDNLKRMQDLLGDVHDLDVLRVEIRRRCSGTDPAVLADWLERIEAARTLRLDEFRSTNADKESLWHTWRAGLQGGNTLKTVSLIEAQSSYSAS